MKFNNILEKYMVKRIYHPRNVSLSPEFRQALIKEYKRNLLMANINADKFMKALLFMVKDIDRGMRGGITK